MSITQPAVLHDLVAQYERLSALPERTAEDQRRMERISGALCVAGGTPDVGSALRAVRRHLSTPTGR